MKTLRPFSLLKRMVRERLDLQIAVAIICLAAAFLTIGGYLNFLRAQEQERTTAIAMVREMVSVVEGNAAIAAYLQDLQMALEISSGLQSSRYISMVVIDIVDGEQVSSGVVEAGRVADFVLELASPFDPATAVGSIRVYANLNQIEKLAASKGRSVVSGQLALLLMVSIAILWAVRVVVTRPLGSVVGQLRQIDLSNESKLKEVATRSEDEIGYLAKNINSMLSAIHSAYLSQAEQARRIALLERKFRLIFEGSHAGIVLVDEHNRLSLANPAFQSLVEHLCPNLDQEEAQPLARLFKDPDLVEEILARVRQNHGSVFHDLMLAGDLEVWVRAVFSVIESQNSDEEGYIEVVFSDISDRALIEQHFEYGATHDQLTGLLNRRGGVAGFPKQIEQAQARGGDFILCLIDLNDFKPVNDVYGHDAGDIVLKEISLRLQGALRADDVIVRWGGDEFVVSMLAAGKDAVDTVGRNLLSVFAQPVEIRPEVWVQVGGSIGIASSERVGFSVERLVEAADEAMYVVKKGDKNSYWVFGDSSLEQKSSSLQ
ncbi:sensor domain-containing diguanylate cyclase [Marinobacterium lutimaris]|uniref:Diguanylate cyclase (GGDEF) domain-containing protein n=1 Tax=Marinobacterium lutimaris TaxID=568106 RepID=A0A1H5YWX3_9GAMM|nr:diguanylate cyclase [Marinobacterium lutimaris]SEG28292.1 diguanylate cyclase (GGDEF) domain-containing protein [Marinobacterium lutimaris]